MPGIESLLRGRVLGDRYRIEEVIGRGGMGAVYRSTDERLGRRVAVKVITVTGGADPEARERIRARFLREARAAAALPHHPNVVPVYDYGTDPEIGLDYLVMELLQGEDLATRMASGERVPLSNGIWILHEAARGVAVGHRAGLIHRDVKPGNIFLARSDHDEIEVRVLDFGIAKLIAEEDTLTQLTQDGRVPLSPAFASPEQLRGLSKITPASDVFSLGAVGFQLLTGERPFSDADRNRISLGMSVPVPSPRAFNPAIPAPLDEALRRALAYDAADRYDDAAEFASVLAQVRREMGDAPLPPYTPVDTGRPAASAPVPPAFEDRTEFLEDDRTLLDPSLARETAPRAGPPPQRTAAGGPPARPPLPPRRRAEERRGPGLAVAALVVLLLLAAGVVFAMIILNQREPTRVTTEVPAAPDTMPDILPEEPIEELPEPTELDALVYNQEGTRLFRAGDFQAALAQYRAAVEISPGNPEYRNNYAYALFRLGLVQEADEELSRVIQTDPNRAIAYANLADVRLELGDTIDAIAALEQFLSLSTEARQRAIAERRLADLRRTQVPPPVEAPPMDTLPPPGG